MSIDAALRVMRILLVRTPTTLILEHVECEDFLASIFICFIKILSERLEFKKTFRYKIIFNA